MTQGIILATGKSVDFYIKGVFSYQLFGQTFWITTTHICVLIVLIALLVLSFAVGKLMKTATEVPGGAQNVLELAVDMLDGMVFSNMGKAAPRFRNYVSTIFLFILFCNWSGLMGLRNPTADYGVTFPLALITFFLIHINSIRAQKVGGYLKSYLSPIPVWAPFNLIGELAVPVSMSLRLFANILTGVAFSALIYQLLGLAALVWPAFLHVYFDLFSGGIQTYVFCMLTMTYIANGVNVEEA